MSGWPIEVTATPTDWAAWTQAVLSSIAVLAAIGLAWVQYIQRRKEDRQRERVIRLSAIGAVRLAVGHVSKAAIRCGNPIEKKRIAEGFPFYALEQADNAIARFPVHLLGHEDGVELFIGIRTTIMSARIRIERIHLLLAQGKDADPEIGFLVNEARMARIELRKLREILVPGSEPFDKNHPAELLAEEVALFEQIKAASVLSH
ncbi:MAG TPA: hypothetical protein VG269_02020 [Tepidisphaeraceae bacterium]|jgi:hypothetical protein|nr:hypothetical protein [Tepidisphaeraceae bacterium]